MPNDPADRARAVVAALKLTHRQVAEFGGPPARCQHPAVWCAACAGLEVLTAFGRAERAAAWAEAATFVDEAEWTELPGDAFPMRRSRFNLALASAVGKIAAALRQKGEGA